MHLKWQPSCALVQKSQPMSKGIYKANTSMCINTAIKQLYCW